MNDRRKTAAEGTSGVGSAGRGRDPVFLLVGNPNSGKTTIFNALTGMRQKVANYPGVTVEKKTGRMRLHDGRLATVIDLPGTYSLISRSPDERVAAEVIRGQRADVGPFDAVIAVVDASNLGRNLYLVSQLIEEGHPLVIALTMMDIATRRGLNISPERLSDAMGVPVAGLVGHKREGIDRLLAAVPQARVAKPLALDLPGQLRAEVDALSAAISAKWPEISANSAALLAERLLVGEASGDSGVAAPIVRDPVLLATVAAAHARLAASGIDPVQADIEAHYRWVEAITAASLVPGCAAIGSLDIHSAGTAGGGTMLPPVAAAPQRTLTQRIDRWLVHRVWGFVFFAAVMSLLFLSIFSFAGPLMEGVSAAFDWAGTTAAAWIGPGMLADLVKDGIIGGVGGVLVFVPQIALLFLFLAILEDSGYLARAAFLMDRVLGRVGLNGKSFIPLLSSFACAIPGIMATRTIENRRERLATILVAPFMSCSARLPVYTLLISVIFANHSAWQRAMIMVGLYALGVVAAGLTAWGLSWWARRADSRGSRVAAASTFIMELPAYRMPMVGAVARQVWWNTRQFVVRAGTTILAISVILWALLYFPRPTPQRLAEVRTNATQRWTLEAESQNFPGNPERQAWIDQHVDHASEAEHRRGSLGGMFGHAIEPAIRPLGYDWKMGVGLVSAFAAREVFVSGMQIVYAVGEGDDATGSLGEAMKADRYADGRPVWTTATAVSLLVWFCLAMQCMSTIAVVRRETGGWRWPVAMTLYMNGVAYLAALVAYQSLRAIGL